MNYNIPAEIRKKYFSILSIIFSIISISLSGITGKDNLYHTPAFCVASVTGIALLALLLFRMTEMKIADHEIKGQDWGIPFIYTIGFILLVVFYIIEWYFLGCYGAPNPNTQEQLLGEISNHPGLLDSFYFSVITATTLGYGDLAPLTSGAKMLASTQALTCSIYMTTGLAILLTKRREPVDS